MLHKPDFVFIAEPWMLSEKFPDKFWRDLKLKIFAVNDRGPLMPNLWCSCAEQWNPNVIVNFAQHVSFTIMAENRPIGISAIYASTNYLRRRIL